MIPAALLLAAIAYVAFKLGQASEQVKRAPGSHDLSEELRRAAARREWRAR